MITSALLRNLYHVSSPVQIVPAPQSGKNNTMSIVQTGEGNYFLREYGSASYRDPIAIEYENNLLKYLSEENLPFAVPLPVRNSAGRYVSQYDTQYFSLTPAFPGERLNPANLTHVEQMGRLTGQMHRVLENAPIQKRPGQALFTDLFAFADAYYDLFSLAPADIGMMQPDDETWNRFAWWRDEVIALRAFVDSVYSTLPQQICHNDITPGNILVQDNTITALLDFEFITMAARSLDMAMVLRTTMRLWENPAPLDTVRHFFTGYKQFIKITPAEIQALPMLMRLRSALPIIWWLGQNQNLANIPTMIGYHQNMVRWLNTHNRHFLKSVLDAQRHN